MSDNPVDNFTKDMLKDEETEKAKKELYGKKLVLDTRKVNLEMERVTQAEKEMELARATHFGALTEDQIENLKKQNDEYIESAKNGATFVNEEFSGIVPFFRKNLILVGGVTGEGKSTTVANIVWSTLQQKNPATGKWRRALVITNEEKSEDVYNRVTCLAKGWHYVNHDKFSEDQKNTFGEWISKLAKDGRLTVVDNNHNGALGLTTSIEGIQTIFDNLIRDKEYYDVVIIDYYQNFKYSKNNPTLNEFSVQATLANLLDRYKNEYPAPIVVLAQINPPDDEDKVPFQYRIKGRKIIMDPSTFVMEMIADKGNLRTQWVIHKSRFTESIGKGFFTGYSKGKFVKYDQEFQREVLRLKEERQWAKIGRHVFEDKKEDKK